MARVDSKSSDPPIGDGPAITEQQWYTLAVVSASLTAVAVVIAFWWIFGDGFDASDLGKAQALAPFGVALFALVTFCTAGWRGAINVRQANQSESEGRAKLLQEGAKFLAEVDKASHVSAGVASLGVLVVGPDKEYAWQAMNLLADFVEDHMRFNHYNRHRPRISGVMRNGVRNGVNTGRDIVFDCTEDDSNEQDDEGMLWYYIPGFNSIRYEGGIFPYDDNYELSELQHVAFWRVEINGWASISVNERFHRCSYSRCDITSVSSMLALLDHKEFEYAFDRCDFSGCRIEVSQLLLVELKKQNNYYVRGTPPMLVGSTEAIKWEDLLHCVEAKPDRNIPF